jgi:hypothetical protein
MTLAEQPTLAAPNDRRRADRRRRATPMFSRYALFGGRRVEDRRSPATQDQYVDRYPIGIAVSLIVIALLCALDAVFTLLYLQKGGGELNPLMDTLIQGAGPTQFLVLKCIVTNVGLVILCLHKNFRFVRAVIGVLLTIYAALFAYHIYLAAIVA